MDGNARLQGKIDVTIPAKKSSIGRWHGIEATILQWRPSSVTSVSLIDLISSEVRDVGVSRTAQDVVTAFRSLWKPSTPKPVANGANSFLLSTGRCDGVWMKIVEHHSHLNGHEYILVHKPEIWQEIAETISLVDAETCRSNVSPEKDIAGRKRFSPQALNRRFHEAFKGRGWHKSQGDFSKDRIAIRVHFGRDEFGPYDLFARHIAFYVGDVIDVGVEILPMKEMSAQMSSGISYYEGELYNVIRQGRGVPAVPLVLIGVAP